MNFNFELILFYAVIIFGLIALYDKLFLAKKRHDDHLPILVDYAYSFFPILLLVFLLRSFLFEPFRIPSASLEPTLLTGDFIIVNKYEYGIRLPVIHTKLFEKSEPKRGDIFVFRYPPNPSIDYIKRVVGLPGDHLKYIDRTLYINGKKIPQDVGKPDARIGEDGNQQTVIQKQEDLLGVKHAIYQIPDRSSANFQDIVVPEGMYFAMGDNRDDSADSRDWGFVPEKNIVGKAVFVWLSWDSIKYRVRWDRFAMSIH